MLIIKHPEITNLHISPRDCVAWIRESFCLKKQAILPTKISIHPQGEDFFNTMPCLLPRKDNATQFFGVKVVNRIEGNAPSLSSEIFLYNAQSGELVAVLDGDWITTMRTGAVAALATQLFRQKKAETYGFIGLGNTARAALLCLLESEPERQFQVLLLKYKNQAELFCDRFKEYKNVTFDIAEDAPSLVKQSDVVISCLTASPQLLCPDDTLFRRGVTVIPVHTRGFQNCDLFFDRIVCDDIGHISNFKYFDRFRNLCEMSEVIDGSRPGRQNDEERFLCYNIGLGLHDVLFAGKILERISGGINVSLDKEQRKFWV